ncbi:MAG: isoprenylcysteine carboxylmethyltransferase family protein [Betaproteobacteria bacterium]|nr:MAG: isoprenylcysteine carboxylmethyltransferase family protein [Betaproteobacteria bacterium]
MRMFYAYAVPALWLAWCIYWWVAGRDVKPVTRRESAASRAGHILPLVIAVMLLALPSLPYGLLSNRLLSPTHRVFFVGIALVVAGLLFTIWARLYLGRNWSGVVTLKKDHELVRGGPYRFVRHPIYSGLLLAIAGSAVVRGEWRGVLALIIAFVALWRKLRLEERWLGEAFGEQYAAYRAEVAALIPFVL